MEKKIRTPRVTIHTSDIVKIVHEASLSCYGIVGILDKKMVSHLDVIKKGKKEEAIFVKKGTNNTFSVDVYLMLSSDVKITETLSSTQETILYSLNKKYPKLCKKVNVYSEAVSSK